MHFEGPSVHLEGPSTHCEDASVGVLRPAVGLEGPLKVSLLRHLGIAEEVMAPIKTWLPIQSGDDPGQ